jgi:hypothetical protein
MSFFQRSPPTPVFQLGELLAVNKDHAYGFGVLISESNKLIPNTECFLLPINLVGTVCDIHYKTVVVGQKKKIIPYRYLVLFGAISYFMKAEDLKKFNTP